MRDSGLWAAAAPLSRPLRRRPPEPDGVWKLSSLSDMTGARGEAPRRPPGTRGEVTRRPAARRPGELTWRPAAGSVGELVADGRPLTRARLWKEDVGQLLMQPSNVIHNLKRFPTEHMNTNITSPS